MAKSKTDWKMLNELSSELEEYCHGNDFDVRQCSEYQWNVQEPVQNILLAVYPGSGLAYAQRLHHTHTGLIDDTSKKFYFHDWKSMKKMLDDIFFAIDKL